MKRTCLALLLALGLMFPTMPSIYAAVKVGSPCPYLDELKKNGSKVFVCAKTKNKFSWKVATSTQAKKYLAELIADKAAEEAIHDQLIADKAVEAASEAAIAKSRAAADKAAADIAAADKAAADKAAADKAAADKAAADKAAAGLNPFGDGVAKAAADKAAADKAAADKAAADKAAADKAAANAGLGKTCVVAVNCPIGSTGPGGGIVFYDAGSQQSWGRYLEFAPSGWSDAAKPNQFWCDVRDVYFYKTVTDATLKATLGFLIGQGKANTNLMLAGCRSGAAVLAHSYKGGGKSDWYLPSYYELNELCKYARSQATGDPTILCSKDGALRAGFENYYYWSSTEYGADYAYALNFGVGVMYYSDKNWAGIFISSVRAF